MDIIQDLTARKLLQSNLNPTICTGIAVSEFEKSLDFLSNLLTSVFDKRTPGFKFVGIERATPEDAANLMRTCNSFQGYDRMKSNLFLIRINFTFDVNGDPEPVSREIFLIYPNAHGLTYLAGSLFNVRGVLYDKFLSPSANSVFIRLYKDKSSVNKLVHSVRSTAAPDGRIHEAVTYITPAVAVITAKNTPRSPLMLYLIINFGYEGAMMRTLGFVPEILPIEKFGDDKDSYYFTSDEMSCKTANYMRYFNIPSKFKNKPPVNMYTIPDVCIRVPKKHYPLKGDYLKHSLLPLNTAMGAMFYILDHFHTDILEALHDREYWINILGVILFGSKVRVNKRYADTMRHLNALDNLVDVTMVEKIHLEFGDDLGEDFSRDGYYGILLAVYRSFNEWIATSSAISASCYDKRIENLYSVFYQLILSTNRLPNLMDGVAKNRITDARYQVNTGYLPGGAYSIRRKKANEIVVLDNVSITCDNRVLSTATNICLQLNLNSSGNKKGPPVADASMTLDPSHAIGGSPNSLTKAKLQPLATVNPFVRLVDNVIVPTQKQLDSMKPLAKVLAKGMGGTEFKNVPAVYRRSLSHLKL